MRHSKSHPNWRCSWRVDSLDNDYSPGVFSKAEKFPIPGQGGKARTVAELQSGTKLVKKIMGKYYKKGKHVVSRRPKFFSSPGPVYVKLKTKDELDPPINPQKFSKYQRFVPSLQFTNQVRDGGFHKLTAPAVPIYADSRAGYIQPIQKNQPRTKKSAIKQPPHTYLGLGLHMADLKRPGTVQFDVRDRFDDTFERLRVKTPGPGHYKRPKDSCYVHNPNRFSIPFWKPVASDFARNRKDKHTLKLKLQSIENEMKKITKNKKNKKKNRGKEKQRMKNEHNLGGGVKFSTYVEPSLLFSTKNTHLGPGCYQNSAQIMLDLEPRKSPVLKFRPLHSHLTRPSTSPVKQRMRRASSSTSSSSRQWPREEIYSESPDLNPHNFEAHFWETEEKQNQH